VTLRLNIPNDGALGIVWLDLETTGSDKKYDEIIEIGALYSDLNFVRHGETFKCNIMPSDEALGHMMKEPIVREMPPKSGLLDEILSGRCTQAISDAENLLIDWLDLTINRSKRRGPVEKFRFILGGSGVGHFDRAFIDRHMPRLANLLVFFPMDVGNVRRLARFAGFEQASSRANSAKTHRALDDILQHFTEARDFYDLFTKLAQQQELSDVLAPAGDGL
jgi:oligoribonuclease (3'-5' exoribonuclease)